MDETYQEDVNAPAHFPHKKHFQRVLYVPMDDGTITACLVQAEMITNSIVHGLIDTGRGATWVPFDGRTKVFSSFFKCRSYIKSNTLDIIHWPPVH